MLRKIDVESSVTSIELAFQELPGLRLTEPQMQRLWGLDGSAWKAVAGLLVSRHFLIRTDEETYARADLDAAVSRSAAFSRRSPSA